MIPPRAGCVPQNMRGFVAGWVDPDQPSWVFLLWLIVIQRVASA